MADRILANNKLNMRAFSGCDMTAYINGKQCGTLQAVTVSITREALPIYTMGNCDLRAVVRGKRGIAGTLVFTNFDRHALLRDHFADDTGKTLYGTRFGEIEQMERLISETEYSQFSSVNAISDINNRFAINGNPTVDLLPGANGNDVTLTNVQREVAEVYNMVRNRVVRYSDEIPEFDICLTMVNENGDAAWATINGITLLNEGSGYTMDDLSSEIAYTFIARTVIPLTAIESPVQFNSKYGTT